MLKPALTSLAIAALLVIPSVARTTVPARGAPISKGVTTGDLSVQVDQARQQSADMLVTVGRLEGQINTLNGRVEALEFELGRARDTNADLLSDNETLARDAQEMRRAIAGMQVILGIAPEQAAGGYSSTGGSGQSFAMTVPPTNGRGVDSSVPTQLSNGGLPEGSLGTLPASALPGEAGPLFTEAKARLINLDYAGAEEGFQAFIDKFGKDKQAGEAHFWLGEALHQQQAYAESGAAYTTMIRSFPDDARAPDALVRLARAMRYLGEAKKACTALDTLPKRYPEASKVVRDIAAVERTRSGCDS
jgi:tol-pal system protein YbgF